MTQTRMPTEQAFPDLEMAREGLLADGEVVGVLADGRVAFWSQGDGGAYLTGATVREVAERQLGVIERERLERDCWSIGLQAELGLDLAPAPCR